MSKVDFNVGDLVKVAKRPLDGGSFLASRPGIITDIESVEDLFSEKYAIMEIETYIDVLCEGEVLKLVLGEDLIEKVDE